MADEMVTSTPEPEPAVSVDPVPVPARAHLSRWRIAGLAVAVVVLGGGIAVAVAGSNDKSVAEHDQSRATTQLHTQRADTRRTEAELASDRTRLDPASRALAAPLATASGLIDLVGQGAAAQNAVQDAGISGSVSDYNAAVDHDNAIVDQFNATVDRLDQQIKALPGSSSLRA